MAMGDVGRDPEQPGGRIGSPQVEASPLVESDEEGLRRRFLGGLVVEAAAQVAKNCSEVAFEDAPKTNGSASEAAITSLSLGLSLISLLATKPEKGSRRVGHQPPGQNCRPPRRST
jgi:hypothetical protein